MPGKSEENGHPLDALPSDGGRSNADPRPAPKQDVSKVQHTEPGGSGGVEITPEQERERDAATLRKLTAQKTGQAPSQTGSPASDPAIGSTNDLPPGEASDTKGGSTPQPSFREEGQTSDAEQAPADDKARREAEVIARPWLERAHGKEFAEQLLSSMSTDELNAQASRLRKQFADVDRNANQVHNTGQDDADVGVTDDSVGGDPAPAMDLSNLPAARRRMIERAQNNGDHELARDLYDEWSELEGRMRVAGARPTVAELASNHRADLDVLAKLYPRLEDPAERNELMETAGRLLRGGTFTRDVTPQQVFQAAASVMYGAPSPTEHQARIATQRHKELNGSPTPPRGRSTNTPTKMNAEDADKEAIRRLTRGESPRDVNRWHAGAVSS